MFWELEIDLEYSFEAAVFQACADPVAKLDICQNSFATVTGTRHYETDCACTRAPTFAAQYLPAPALTRFPSTLLVLSHVLLKQQKPPSFSSEVRWLIKARRGMKGELGERR